jgi:putative ABC transport system permease protein
VAGALVTIAVVVGLNVALFAVIEAGLWQRLPYRDPGRLVAVWKSYPGMGFRVHASAWEFSEWRDHVTSLDALAALKIGSADLQIGDLTERVRRGQISANFLSLLGIRPVTGRLLQEDAVDLQGAVLGESFWRTELGADPGVVGTSIRLTNGPPGTYTVVGVVPDLAIPRADQTPEAVYTVLPPGPVIRDRGASSMWVYGRLRAGASRADARAELLQLQAERHLDAPGLTGDVVVTDLHDAVVAGRRPGLALVAAAVGVLVLMACSTLVTLRLVQLTSRRDELGLRLALGASNWRLARTLIGECLPSLVAGTAFGYGLGAVAIQAVRSMTPDVAPWIQHLRFDGAVAFAGLATTVGLLFVFGIGPALVVQVVARGFPAPAVWSGRNRQRRLRQTLMVVEIASLAVLLAASTLLTRSVWQLAHVPPGFDAQDVLIAEVDPPPAGGAGAALPATWRADVLRQLRNLPGVQGAATSDDLPYVVNSGLRPAGRPGQAEEYQAVVSSVDSGYFAVMKIPLVDGRSFSERDRAGQPVAIVSSSLGRRMFPGTGPVGRQIELSGAAYTVVGVAGDVTEVSRVQNGVRVPGLNATTLPWIYLSGSQASSPREFFVVRTDGPTNAVATAFRRIVRSIDPSLPVQFDTFDRRIDTARADTRSYALLLALLGVVAVTVSCAGVYGMTRAEVRERRHEIGVRLAIGATPRGIARLIRLRLAALTGGGLLLALFAFVLARQIVRRFVFGGVEDVPTFLFVAGAVGALMFLAAWGPARQAAATNPVSLLRHE